MRLASWRSTASGGAAARRASIQSPMATVLVAPPSTITTSVSPVTDLTAVSMSPSRPAMAWKKFSVGVSPWMKLRST